MGLMITGSFFAASQASAQTPLVTYSFTGAAGSEDSLAADAQPANAKFSKTGRAGTGVVGTAAGNVYNSTGFPSGTTVDLTKYISVSGTPFTNFSLNLTSLELYAQRSGTGPKTAEIRSSADNYATVLGTIDLAVATSKTETITFPTSHGNLTSRTEFRIYPYNGTPTGTFRIDNVKFFGSVQSAGPAAPTLNFASATSSVAENVSGGTLSIPVTITNPSATTATTVTVAVATAGGTATSGTDYTITTGTLTFPAGSSTNQDAVLTIIDDVLVEGNETINLILMGASTGAVIGANATHTVTIIDNEVAPEISFGSPVAVTVAENVTGGTLNIPVTISAAPSSPVTVEVAVATPGGTATPTSDYVFAPQTLTFTPGGALTQNAVLTIVNDKLIEANETVILTLRNATGGNIGTANTYTVTIVSDDAVPLYTVAQVTTNHPTTFVADSLNKIVSVTGTLYGVNQRPGGYQLQLIDATGGIDLFRGTYPTTASDAFPVPAPVEGDSVQAWGVITQFNGLTELNLDSIRVYASNHFLRAPKTLSGPQNESHESELVRTALPVTLVTPSQWKTTGTAGFNVDITDGTNTYQMRILPTTNIFGTPAPSGPFFLTATGAQNDNASPYDAFYQLIPRRLSDIQLVTGISEDLSSAVSIYPNPASGILNLNLSALAGKKATISVVNTLGQVVATVPANATQINVSKFPAGIYTIQVVTPEAKAVKRFVKIN